MVYFITKYCHFMVYFITKYCHFMMYFVTKYCNFKVYFITKINNRSRTSKWKFIEPYTMNWKNGKKILPKNP
jgi:hypothetical protein